MPKSAAPELAPLRAELTAYETSAVTARLHVGDAPPLFRVRMHCSDAGDEADLLGFLRRDGIFAYAVEGGIEAVSVEDSGQDAPRELIARVADWFSSNDAALAIRLA